MQLLSDCRATTCFEADWSGHVEADMSNHMGWLSVHGSESGPSVVSSLHENY